MANPSKAKGTDWETTIVNYLNDLGPLLKAKRTGSENFGAGDIHVGDWTIEAKAEQKIDLPGYLKQLDRSTERSDRINFLSAVWVKNRRHSVEDAYVVMSGSNYRSLMGYVTGLELIIKTMRGEFNG